MRHVDEGVLHAYLDGELEELSPEEARAMQLHLAGCPTCRARLADAQSLRTRAQQILQLGRVEQRPIPTFDAVLRRAGERAAAPPRRPVDHRRILHRRGVALGWAASLVIALCAGWFASEIRFRLADPAAYGAREMQGVPAVSAPAPVPEAATRHDQAGSSASRFQPEPLTPAEFYGLYAALPALEQFQSDPAAAAEPVLAWERSHPELAQAYPAVHLLRWFHAEVERLRRRADVQG